jgi:hypothetical protein
MIIKRLTIIVLVFAFAHTTFGQSRRLSDLASRLATDARAYADSSYRSYSGSFRSSRTDIEAAMLAHQFSAASQLFSRMVVDRRRNQDLRDGFQIVQNLGQSMVRSNQDQNRWDSIQRTLGDIARELNNDSSGDNQYPAPPSSSGRMTWRGRVDDDVRIIIRGGRADVQTIGGTPYYDAVSNFSAAMPNRRVTVRLNVRRSRGQVFIEQQPTRDNDFSTIIRIRDPKGGASDYEFELSW